MAHIYKFMADKEHEGMRVEKFLASQINTLSRMKIFNLIKKGSCSINQKTATLKQIINQGDEIVFSIEQITPDSTLPENIPLEIVYEDDAIMVVVKPAGMLVHPTLGVKSGTLLNALSYHLNKTQGTNFIRPGLVHRLDRATSGLMVIAKTQEALSRLSNHFSRKLVKKIYLAIVDGNFVEDEMKISAPIGRDEASQPRWRVIENGKAAETHLRVLERKEKITIVELTPITGRTNQLRIHCAHIGHPIAGDDWYGGSSFKRLCLHAAKLTFFHPIGNKQVEFVSPLPRDIEDFLKTSL